MLNYAVISAINETPWKEGPQYLGFSGSGIYLISMPKKPSGLRDCEIKRWVGITGLKNPIETLWKQFNPGYGRLFNDHTLF